MPPEAPVIEPPPTPTPDYVPPQKPETPKLKVKAGDIFKAEFEKLTKAQQAEPETKKDDVSTRELHREIPDTDKTKIPEPVPKPEAPKEEKQLIPDKVKPESPLDTLLSGEKPKEEKVEEPDVLKDFDEKTANWQKAREVMKRQSEEKKALEATVAELKKTPKSDPEEIARLAKERDDLKQSLAEREELLKSVDVRLSEDYQTTLQRRDKGIAKVASKAKAYGADADALVGALNLPDGTFKTQQIKAAMAEVDPEDKTEIRLLIGEVDGYNEQLAEFEKDAPKKYEEIQAKREAKIRERQEASVKQIKSSFAKFMDQLPQKLITAREVPEDVPEGTKWNEDIHAATEKADRVLTPGGSTLEETQDVAWKGSHYDFLLDRYLALHSRSKEMEKRLLEYDSGGPDFKGGDKPKGAEKAPAGSEKYHKALQAIKSASEND